MMLAPIDAHAHIKTTVSERDIADLDAFVVAVTRERAEWGPALARADEFAVWGVGVHPGLPAEIEAFDADAFAAAVEQAIFVGEIGLDRRAKSALATQRAVFRQVLAVVADLPRPASIHSVAATRDVLAALQATPIAAPILHWWRGSPQETDEAIAMGCFFSLNGAEVRNPKVLGLVPPDRVLTETDFPHTKRSDPAASKPAAVSTTEQALMREWGLDILDLRRKLWSNLAELWERCERSDTLPAAVQDTMLAAGLD